MRGLSFSATIVLSTFVDDFSRAKANFTHVVDRLLSLDGSCGVGNSTPGTGSHGHGLRRRGF